MTNFDKVGFFMKTFGQEVKKKASLSSEKVNKLSSKVLNLLSKTLKDAAKNNARNN